MPTGVYPRKPLNERFWAKVDIRGPDDCWPWVGARNGYGCGHLGISGKNVSAHRLAYELVKGPILDGTEVCHSCDNHPCCNPAHLWPGTHLDNMQDAVAKGRSARGERNGSHKLTSVQATEIRDRYESGDITQCSLGAAYGVSGRCVSDITTGRTWGHVK